MAKKYHVHIPATTSEELKKELIEAAELLTGLFDAVDKYDNQLTGAASSNKRYWKNKAQAWVDKHKIHYPEEQ